ncbi:DNA methylase [Mycobacterium phage Nerujay]|uniref:DNA methyltransferase n=1 Tax=Mycobacterium phage Nerujay TaxID=1647308 RepID=UPI000624B070|nr:DNA methyltransferase [Mycobacterium phage Nerujay]AKF14825.1 DNA methylase [Mycobacterium phage Nerujay]
MSNVDLRLGDCRDILTELEDASVDAILTDPPYELGFMGKKWDGSGIAFDVEMWEQCLRVLKPGGHMLAFGGSRTWHRLTVAIEDAGFEIRDSIAWLYGSGFPKSLNVSKAIDKAAGAEREVRQWQGWSTALKPSFEPIVVARKPLVGTVAANVLEHGTGALNIDACRIGDGSESQGPRDSSEPSATRRYTGSGAVNIAATPGPRGGSPSGRWPTNVVLDDTQAAELDAQSGIQKSGTAVQRNGGGQKIFGGIAGGENSAGARPDAGYNDEGGASRFFPVFKYQAKAPTKERPKVDGVAHPTVKPLELMRWLVKLVTPPGGVVLDPFAGSGTTVEACLVEGFDCIAIENEADYIPLIERRISRSTT